MGIPKTGAELIAESIRIREKAAVDLLAGIPDIEAAMLKQISKRLNEMSAGPDGLKLTAANAKRLNKLESEILDIVRSGKYKMNVGNYLREFSPLEMIQIEKHNVINGLKIPKGFLTDIKQHSLEFAEKRLLDEGFEAGFVDPLMERVANLVLTGADAGDIAAELETQIAGGNSSLSRYVEQIATDTVNQYNGAMDQKIGKEFGLKWIIYSGSIIKTSREQCIRWVNKQYLHESELQSEINWAENNGSGMIPGTTPSTFAINTGGYNCRHDATWIADEFVPADIPFEALPDDE